MTLLLKWVSFRIRLSVNMYFACLHFNWLTRTLGWHQFTLNGNGTSGLDTFDQILIESIRVGNHLYIVNCASIVDGDKYHILVSPTGSNPSLYTNILIGWGCGQKLLNRLVLYNKKHISDTKFVFLTEEGNSINERGPSLQTAPCIFKNRLDYLATENLRVTVELPALISTKYNPLDKEVTSNVWL